MNFMIDPIKDIKVKIVGIALKSRTTLYMIYNFSLTINPESSVGRIICKA